MTAKTFDFTHAGKKYSIPAFNALPIGVIRKARRAKDDMDQAFTIIETVCGDDSPALAAIDSMDMAEFEAFISGWTQGASVGESVSSEN